MAKTAAGLHADVLWCRVERKTEWLGLLHTLACSGSFARPGQEPQGMLWGVDRRSVGPSTQAQFLCLLARATIFFLSLSQAHITKRRRLRTLVNCSNNINHTAGDRDLLSHYPLHVYKLEDLTATVPNQHNGPLLQYLRSSRLPTYMRADHRVVPVILKALSTVPTVQKIRQERHVYNVRLFESHR